MSFLSKCYEACNNAYVMTDPNRLYCKKGCDCDDEGLSACKDEFCFGLCVKDELGEGEEQKPGWTKWFARAPGTHTSEHCLEACVVGCNNREEEEDD